MSDYLKEWYEQIDPQAIAANGKITMRIPAEPSSEKPEDPYDTSDDTEPSSDVSGDELQNKSGVNYLKSYVYAAKIKSKLIKLATLQSPYTDNSIEREKVVKYIKTLYEKLGEVVNNL